MIYAIRAGWLCAKAVFASAGGAVSGSAWRLDGMKNISQPATSTRGNKLPRLGLLGFAAAMVAAAPLASANAQDLLWVRQAGTAANDYAQSVATDTAGNVYITGSTNGNLGGLNAGEYDIFLAKYDASGVLMWVQQTGSTGDDEAAALAVDRDGNVYVTGASNGNLGGPNAGNYDIFLAKYGPSGSLLWMRQSGTVAREDATGVAIDSVGNAYITGSTRGNLAATSAGVEDVFLAKYDAAGTLLWMRQSGSAGADWARGVAVDAAGNAYVAGLTLGNFGGASAGGYDMFLAKYDAAGSQLWARQSGTVWYDGAGCVAVDVAGNAYIAGFTQGNQGVPTIRTRDVVLAKYDPAGTQLWFRQLFSFGSDEALSVAVDVAGNVYTTGFSAGNLGGANAGGYDSFVAKHDATGSNLWIRQISTARDDVAYSITTGPAGNACIAGYTTGDLSGPSVGGYDIFVAKFGAPACGSIADIAGGPGGIGPDGIVDGLDFIAFINSFSTGDPTIDPLADVAGSGNDGLSPDGIVDGNDFIAFINAFSSGC